MDKLKLGPIPLVYPIPIVLAGANVSGEPNYVTLGDCGIMGIKPPLVFISAHRDHYTTQGVLENNSYSINLPTTDLLVQVDYCGMVSGREVDKGALFATFYGELGTAPMIRDCPVNLECVVEHSVTIEHRQIFIGRVIETYVSEGYAPERDGKPALVDLTRLDPIIYALDNRYYRIGKPIGRGYHEGKRLMTGGRSG